MKKWITAVSFIAVLTAAVSIPLSAATPKQQINKVHTENGLTCEDCHGSENPSTVPKNVQLCIDCHTDMTNAEANKLTEKGHTIEYWVHDSHEMPEKGCTECHKQHEPTKFWCNKCHTFTIKVP